MNIFQLQKKTRKAKNIIRRANQQLTRVQAKGYNNERESEIHFRISKAQTFLDKVEEWNKNRLERKPFRSSLPYSKQRELGLAPSVEALNEWRANNVKLVVRDEEGKYTSFENIALVRKFVQDMAANNRDFTKIRIFKVK